MTSKVDHLGQDKAQEHEHVEPEPPVAAKNAESESTAGKFSRARKEAFSRYLEDISFVKAMTQVVVELYEEPVKPADPVEYFLNRIVTNLPLESSLKTVREEIAGYEKKLTTLKSENQTLREKLLRHEKIPDQIKVEEYLDAVDGEKKEQEHDIKGNEEPILEINANS